MKRYCFCFNKENSNIVEEYFLYGKDWDAINPKPHITNQLNNELNELNQKEVLIRFLSKNGEEEYNLKGYTTYQLIKKAIDLIDKKIENFVSSVDKPFNIDTLELADCAFNKNDKYRLDEELIIDAFKKHPDNNNLDDIVYKILLIDFTNSTDLNKTLDKDTLKDFAEFIKTLNFDERIKNKDFSVVDDLCHNGKTKKILSFASKYATYHERFVSSNKEDHFIIYDSVNCKFLPKYIKEKGVNESKLINLKNEKDGYT